MTGKRAKAGGLVFLLVFFLILPWILKNNYYQQVANNALIYTMVVLGLNCITGLTGQMVLGMSGVFAIGAYTSGILFTRYGWSFLPCLAACILVGILVALIIGFPCLRLRGIYLAIATIGFGEIVRLAITNLEDLTGGTIGLRNIGGIHFTGSLVLRRTQHMYYVFLAFLILFIWISVKVSRSQLGMAFRSIKDNELAASTLGMNVTSLKMKAFLFCCIFASIAGMFYGAAIGYISPNDFTYDMSVRYVMMLIIGGIGTVPGAVLGGILVTVLPEILRFMQEYYWCLFGAITVLMVVLRPYGIISIVEDIGKRLRKPKGVGKNAETK